VAPENAEAAVLVGGALVGRGGGPESKASAFKPASTIARSWAGRLITVAHTKRLGSKALVGRRRGRGWAVVGVHEDVGAALQFGVDAARRFELEGAGAEVGSYAL
jgi:hypothetical protein